MSANQPHTYGGQAVIEGVMIRGQRNIAIAVRRPDGSIALKRQPLTPIFTGRLRRIPLVRGVIAMAENADAGHARAELLRQCGGGGGRRRD